MPSTDGSTARRILVSEVKAVNSVLRRVVGRTSGAEWDEDLIRDGLCLSSGTGEHQHELK